MEGTATIDGAGQGLDHLGNGIHWDGTCVKRGRADFSDIEPPSLIENPSVPEAPAFQIVTIIPLSK